MLSLDYGETVKLSSSVSVHSLVMTSSDDLAGGGTVELAGASVLLRVTDTLLFARGTFEGPGQVCDSHTITKS